MSVMKKDMLFFLLGICQVDLLFDLGYLPALALKMVPREKRPRLKSLKKYMKRLQATVTCDILFIVAEFDINNITEIFNKTAQIPIEVKSNQHFKSIELDYSEL